MSKGALLIIGGNENKENDTEILYTFVELSQLRKGGIGILPTASEIPDEVSAQYQEVFQRLGAERVEVIDVKCRDQAEDSVVTGLIPTLSAVFMTGGDQSRLYELIGGTALCTSLYENWENGLVLAGTSAGASIMGKQMIVASHNAENLIDVEVQTGFGLLENIIIDQHFSQRARFGRLLNTIAENHNVIGIGIDENTAIVVQDNIFTVLGEHQVIVIDGKQRDFVEFTVSANGSEGLTVSGFQLHTLSKGYRFDLSTRKLLNRKER